MAINPLVLFSGFAAATIGGIVVVQQVNKPAPIEQPAIVQKQTDPIAAPLLEPKLNPKLHNSQAPVKKTASIDPKQFPPAKLDEKSLKAASAPIAPSFDVVRVEKDGGAVVVGKAAPNAEISLRLNGKVIGKTKSNKQGDWVFIPDQLIPSGNHEMVIESQEAGKNPVRSKQSIYIAIAKNTKDKPLVVVATPDAATKVLQVPEKVPESVSKTASAKAKTTAATKVAPTKIATTKIAKTEPKAVKALNTIIVTPQASAPPKTSTNIVKKTLPKAITPPEKVAAVQPPKQKQAKQQKLVFGTVDYNDQGNIVFSGKATAGKTVRLYIDNKFIGDAKADENGRWVFKGKKSIKQGVHELRADQVTASGSVSQRTAVPFMRAAPGKVAALIENRNKPEPKQQPSSKTASPTKTNQPASAKGVAKVAPKQVLNTQAKANISQAPEVQKQAADAPSTSPSGPSPSAPAIVNAVQPASKAVANTQPAPNTDQQNKDELVSHVVIQPGNNLWNISRVIYGKGIAYTTIYQANKTQVKDPNRIYPGQILETPGAMSTGKI